jgi:hypothetical protein
MRSEGGRPKPYRNKTPRDGGSEQAEGRACLDEGQDLEATGQKVVCLEAGASSGSLIASSTFFAFDHLCAFSDDCIYRNRFSMMCKAEVSINIRDAF